MPLCGSRSRAAAAPTCREQEQQRLQHAVSRRPAATANERNPQTRRAVPSIISEVPRTTLPSVLAQQSVPVPQKKRAITSIAGATPGHLSHAEAETVHMGGRGGATGMGGL
eukprot:584897-Prorocentrum_lima.AAC.1